MLPMNLFATVTLLLTAGGSNTPVVVQPQESGALFSNPGMGWQTFHHFADEDPNLAGLPSSSAYFRFYWSELEPQEGQIDFSRFDALLEHTRKAGQKLAFRVMCVGTNRDTIHVPTWLKEKGCPGFEFDYLGRGPTRWVPDMDHPLFQEAHFRLIRKLGARYDGYPDLDLVDIGTVGLWGEWHMSSTGIEVPSLETRLKIIDVYCEAFPKTPKVMLIGDVDGMKRATSKGCGWRADCLGDMGGFSKTWNHMEYFYRQQIDRTDAGEAWRTAPVAFESCWDMRKWYNEGWDIPFIFDYALDLHASYLNNKSAPLPDGTRDEIEQFLRKIGYRLVLRRLEHMPTVIQGDSLTVTMAWENVGVAPPYHDYRIALRLRRSTDEDSVLLTGGTSIRGWLPGTVNVVESLPIPTNLPPGEYELSLGVVAPGTQHAAVQLAIEGRAEDGWYPLSKVVVD